MLTMKYVEKEENVTYNSKYIILLSTFEIIIILLVAISLFNPPLKAYIKTNVEEDTTPKKYYNINLYGYYESDIEDKDVKNFNEIKVDYLTTIKVKENDSLSSAYMN